MSQGKAALKPGRTTDCQVARALGWTGITALHSAWADRPNVTEWYGTPPAHVHNAPVPHYTTDLRLAMEALLTFPLWWVEQDDSEEFSFNVQIGRLPGQKGIAGHTAYGRKGDEALTICRAILLAQGDLLNIWDEE